MYIRKFLNKKCGLEYIEADEYGLTLGAWGDKVYLDYKPYSEKERKTIIEKLDTLINVLSEAKNYVIKVNLED